MQTTHISAQVDSAKAVTQIAKEVGDETPLPNAEQRLRQSGLTNGRLNVWVGDDKILSEEEMDGLRHLRTNLSELVAPEAAALVRNQLESAPTNTDVLKGLA